MKKTLTITSADGRPLAVISSTAGRPRQEFASERMAPEVARWVADGLTEWLREGARPVLRVTKPTDPQFFDRLGAYLERQFGFHAAQVEEETVPSFKITILKESYLIRAAVRRHSNDRGDFPRFDLTKVLEVLPRANQITLESRRDDSTQQLAAEASALLEHLVQ